MEFKDGEFITAKDKQTIAANWVKFLDSGFAKRLLTKLLYKHLSLHLGFIAHYNIHGFWDARFDEPDDIAETVKQIMALPPYYFTGDYGDINLNMREELEKRLPDIEDSIRVRKRMQLRETIRNAELELRNL